MEPVDEPESERLMRDIYGEPTLSPEQALRLDALTLAVTHHQNDHEFRAQHTYRNIVESVFQTSDYFFNYVKSGQHVVPVPVVNLTPHPELFVAQ